MGFNFRVTRSTEQVSYHESLEAYLKARGPDEPYRLCRTIVTMNLEALPATQDTGSTSTGSGEQKRTRAGLKEPPEEPKLVPAKGLPWITPVLGSGCLPQPGSSPSASLGHRLRQLDRFFDNSQVVTQEFWTAADIARPFLTALVSDRTGAPMDVFADDGRSAGDGPSDSHHQSDEFEPTRAFAKLVESTAMLTRLYFISKATNCDAVNRWGDDVAVIPNTRDYPKIDQAFVEHTLAWLESLINDHKDELKKPVASVPSVLRRAYEDLKLGVAPGPTVRLSRLRFLTDCIWYGLSNVRPPYPGWTDLLFELSLRDAIDDHDASNFARPYFRDLGTPGDKIRHVYKDVTEQAWQAMLKDPETHKGTIHHAVAALLEGQSRLLLDESIEAGLTMASAFVTTFDVELEMALLLANTPFVVVFPVHIHQSEGAGHASLQWLAAKVTPEPGDDTLSALLQPTRVVAVGPPGVNKKGPYPEADSELAKLATVVRLSGCPLIDLPVLNTGQPLTPSGRSIMAAVDPNGSGKIERLSHAVLLDEYAAMHQTSGDEKLLPDAFGQPARGQRLRYWMVMGLQMRDSAVRQRLTGHLGGLLTRGSPSDYRPQRNGVFINRTIETEHRELLYWYGFDVVAADCEDLTSELLHMAGHLQTPFAFEPLANLQHHDCVLYARGGVS